MPSQQYSEYLKNRSCNLGDYRHIEGRGVYLSIHLGSTCNLNCTYCDRDAIKELHGNIQMKKSDVPQIINFIKSFNVGSESPLDFITFYGGEPLLWVEIMDDIMTGVLENVCQKMKFQIVTNGLLILKNKDFFQKWNQRLMISLSYDFSYQESLRESPTNSPPLLIDDTLDFLHQNVSNIELYYTVPPDSRDFFSIDRIAPIVKLFSQHRNKINKLSLVLARFTYKPNVGFIDLLTIPGFSLNEYFTRMKQFLEVLYVYKIPVCLDGVTPDIGLPSTDNYDYYILSADGYLYPEYVTAEYHNEKARKGQWKDKIEIYHDWEPPILEKCKSCIYMDPPICNDIHFYYTWADNQTLDKSPCKDFTKLIDIFLNRYNYDLNKEDDLIKHINKKPEQNQQVTKTNVLSDANDLFYNLKYVDLLLTNSCNLKCDYCYMQHVKNYEPFTPEKIKQAWDFLANINSKYFKYVQFFGGEPLIHNKLILSFMNQYKNDITKSVGHQTISVVTNGLLLTPQFIQEYFSYQDVRMTVSLDSLNGNTKNRKLTTEQIQKIIDNIKLIASITQPHQLTIQATFTPDQTNEINHWFTSLYNIGVRKFIFHPLINSFTDGWISWNDKTWETFSSTIKNILSTHKDLLKFQISEGVGEKGRTGCMSAAMDEISIDGSGDFSGCYKFVSRKEDVPHTILGNLFKNEINRVAIMEIQSEYEKLQKLPECQDCNTLYCYQCPAGNAVAGRPVFQPDDMCKKIAILYTELKQITPFRHD
jgi:sulfatase maturation enzyme AslB (radical SAM superfamily)